MSKLFNLHKNLQLIQKAAARVPTRISKRDHICPVLASLHWLPVKSRIDFKIHLLTYKALTGLSPSYLQVLIFRYIFKRTFRSQGVGLLVVPRIHKSTHLSLRLNSKPLCLELCQRAQLMLNRVCRATARKASSSKLSFFRR